MYSWKEVIFLVSGLDLVPWCGFQTFLKLLFLLRIHSYIICARIAKIYESKNFSIFRQSNWWFNHKPIDSLFFLVNQMINFNRLIESWDEAKACKSRIVHVAAIAFRFCLFTFSPRTTTDDHAIPVLLLLFGKAAFPSATPDEVCWQETPILIHLLFTMYAIRDWKLSHSICGSTFHSNRNLCNNKSNGAWHRRLLRKKYCWYSNNPVHSSGRAIFYPVYLILFKFSSCHFRHRLFFHQIQFRWTSFNSTTVVFHYLLLID